MLQLSFARNNVDLIKERLQIRNFKDLTIIDKVVELDEHRRSTQHQLDAQLNDSKKIAKQIGELYKSGKQEEANALREKSTGLKETNKLLEDKLSEIEQQVHNQLVQLPNVAHPSVTEGVTDEDNVEIRSGGTPPELFEGALPHWDILTQCNLMSLELGSKITGSGFPVYIGQGAKLQRSLVAYFLDKAIDAGYTEYIPPLMVNEASAFGTGQLPDKEGQMYEVGLDQLFLIPTAEVPVTNIYRDSILKADQFPIKMTGHSQCFRREAGSYGAHVRGLNRVHQFEKVEIVQLVHPDKSYEVLEEMVAHVEALLKELNLPYRIVRLCGGDLSFASALTFDFEVYSAGQKRWLEVSSVSNFETFQTNRMKIRFKNEAGKMVLAHSLNGSALALPRILASLLENNQTPEGVVIPEVLQPYTGFDFIGF